MNRWLQWYDADHVDGLRTSIAEGPAPKLTELQRATLTVLIERGPIAAGYQSGVWTGPMIGDLIEERFGVRYHNHHAPRLLHQLGILRAAPSQAAGTSRPGAPSHLAPQDLARDQKDGPTVPRRRAFGDEASLWLDGTLYQTWARVGQQPRVDTFGMRRTTDERDDALRSNFGTFQAEFHRESRRSLPMIHKLRDSLFFNAREK